MQVLQYIFFFFIIFREIPSDLAVSTTSHAASIVTDSIGLAAAAGGVVVAGQNQPVQPLSEVISVECEDKVTNNINDCG
jgi:hypothetical protein